MANILKGTIKIDAPGLNETVAKVVADVQKVPKAFQPIAAEAKKMSDGVVASLTKIANVNVSNDVISPTLIQRVEAFGGGVTALPNQLQRLQQSMNAVRPAASGLTNASNSANLAVLNLSRVVQDAPFGFLGIANNINPLLESFQRLQVQSKAAGVSLGSTLKSALIGPAGLGLAVGAISSLLVVFGDRLFRSKSAAEETADKLEKARKALDDYVNSLGDLERANVRGAQSAQEQIIKLQTLYRATQDANIPLGERKKLVDELQKQYPKYFKDISDETILAGGAQKAYEKLATAILAAAKARAAQDEIANLAKEALVLEQQKADALAKQVAAQVRLNAAKAAAGKSADAGQAAIIPGGVSQGGFVSSQETQRLDALNFAQGKYNATLSVTNEIQDKINRNLERQNRLASRVSSIIETNGADVIIPTNAPVKDVKEKTVKVGRVNISDLGEIQIDRQGDTKIRERLLNLFQKTSFSVPIQLSGANVDFDQEAFDRLTNKFFILQEIAGNLQGAFESAFSSILSGTNVFQSLGNAIAAVIRKLIAQLAALAAISGILSLVGGPAGGGFTKIFSGLLNKNFGIKIPGFAKGLWDVPKDEFLARLHKGEMVLPAPIAGVFRNSFPQSAINTGNLSQALAGISTGYTGGGAQINSIAGALNIPSFVRLEAQGDSLVGVMELVNKSQNRIF